jgi:cytoskeletal protein CcmA (bactofilin family)
VPHFNIYTLLFLLLVLVAASVIILTSRNSNQNPSGNNQHVASLTDSEIANLKGTTTVVGTAKQTLDVQSNAVFEGPVLARSNLDVAGNIKVGGSLTLPSLKVSGATTLAGLQVGNSLNVAGSADIQGQLTLHKGLSVTGSTSFGNLSAGTLSVTNLQLSGDISINRHIVTNGTSPAKSSGTALGSGGTASVNGNDTAGTVNVNTGSSPNAGLFISVTFAHAFARTPHVIITPIGSAAGSIQYYVNRSTTGFSIGTSSAPPAGKSFAFDYFVIE